jgi:hypothetical protein
VGALAIKTPPHIGGGPADPIVERAAILAEERYAGKEFILAADVWFFAQRSRSQFELRPTPPPQSQNHNHDDEQRDNREVPGGPRLEITPTNKERRIGHGTTSPLR